MRAAYFVLPVIVLVAMQTKTPVSQESSVDSLRANLTQGSGTVTLNVPELRLSSVNHADLRVENGSIHLRMQNKLLQTDTDHIVHQGDELQIKTIGATSEKKNDYLRIVVAAQDGQSVPVAFELAKGSIATMNETALEAVLSSIFTLPATQNRVGGGVSSKGAPQATKSTQQNASVPTKVRHDNKIVDFPPAAVGLPPMHALKPAGEGCWYEPYYSERWSLEVAYEQCESDRVTVVDGSKGPVERTTLNPGETPLFEVYSKHPEETLTAAVRRIIVGAFKDPAARTACRVITRVGEGYTPGGVHVVATGPYVHRKTYPLSTDGTPCDGLLDGEENSVDFFAYPAENKSVFLLIPDGYGAVSFPRETIHLKATDASSTTRPDTSVAAATQKVVDPKTATGQVILMKDVWVRGNRLVRNDVIEDAVTATPLVHGIAFASQPGAIIISCQASKSGSTALVLRVQSEAYQGFALPAPGNVGTVAIGRSRHDVPLEGSIDHGRFLITVPLTQGDAAELSSQQLITSAQVSLMFPGDFRSISAANLPPADEALDNVLNACHIQTPPRNIARPEKVLSPAEVLHLQLAKLSLGMNMAEVKQALGSSYKYLSATTQNPAVMVMLASDSNNGGYGTTFINGILSAFRWDRDFAKGSQPLALNLLDGVTEKTWLPLTGSSIQVTAWSSDASGNPITLATEPQHPSCRDLETELQSNAPIQNNWNHLSVIHLVDYGPDCGVTVNLRLGTSQQDHLIASSLSLVVADEHAIHQLVNGALNELNQQKDLDRRKANQVKNPF